MWFVYGINKATDLWQYVYYHSLPVLEWRFGCYAVLVRVVKARYIRRKKRTYNLFCKWYLNIIL